MFYFTCNESKIYESFTFWNKLQEKMSSNIFVSWSKSESPAKNGTWNKNKQFLKYMLMV